MKNIWKLAFTAIALLAGQIITGQDFKFGHINKNELIQAMPEFDSARVKLENLQKELVKQLELMSVELNNKYDAYLKESKNLSDIIKQSKEQELSDLNRRIQDFQENARDQLQEKQVEFFQPVYSKVEKAIRDAGRENGYVYIFDVSDGTLSYFNESASTNITPLVKTKLRIK